MACNPIPMSMTPVCASTLDLGPLRVLVDAIAPGASLQASPMPGGASTRLYFRVTLPGNKSAVAMFVPEGGKPEEFQKEMVAPRWPFLEVRDLLAHRGVDVPAVLGEDTARGWLLLEDLGDATLANHLAANPGEKRDLYARAVKDLARAQVSLRDLPPTSVVASRAFDEDLLFWEIEHFREWGVDARGKTMLAEDRVAFDAIAQRLAKRIAGWPRGFTHRDYQSRNLMVRKGGGLVWIDFQDALLGPRVYDLVALLNDSYQEFDRAFVEARLDEFASEAGFTARGPDERVSLGTEFDRVTVQRKLKDAGRFVFIDRMKGNPSFLQFVSPTIKKARDAVARLAPHDPDMAQLGEILHRTLPDEA